ncbi:MAG: hypothetical protein HOW73_23465 [Polyangiaceae bacterium]|nr:hypothetical protein [Polyangiaceae bacterium]
MKRVNLRWLYAALPLAGAVEMVAAIGFGHAAPGPDDYERLVPELASVYREGDLVVVTPRWAEPHVRHAAGDPFFPLRAIARSDDASFPRVVEISLRGARSDAFEGYREVDHREVGNLELFVLENPAPERVVFDFVEALEPGWASAGGTDPPTTCPWNPRAEIMTGGLGGHPGFPRARFVCPDSPYLNVSATVIADQSFLPRRCIWAHPTKRGARVVRYSGVPLGDRIEGHGGMYWMIERERKGAPVTLEVRVDGETVGSVVHEDGDGWKPFSFPLEERAGRPSATVEFFVSSPDYRDRHFCFQADTR